MSMNDQDMGCSFSLHHKVMDSSPKSGHATIEFLESAQTLVKHFDEIKSCQKSKKLVKCIFIFGQFPIFCTHNFLLTNRYCSYRHQRFLQN